MSPAAGRAARRGVPAAHASPYQAWLRLETGQHTGRVQQIQAAPDGKTLVSAGDCTLRVWDAATRQGLVKKLMQDITGDYEPLA